MIQAKNWNYTLIKVFDFRESSISKIQNKLQSFFRDISTLCFNFRLGILNNIFTTLF